MIGSRTLPAFCTFPGTTVCLTFCVAWAVLFLLTSLALSSRATASTLSDGHSTSCGAGLASSALPSSSSALPLQVVGNMAFKQGRVQDLVTDLGGVELLLAQCQIDEESPMLREWGLWAIRNLTEGSEAAQQRIRWVSQCHPGAVSTAPCDV